MWQPSELFRPKYTEQALAKAAETVSNMFKHGDKIVFNQLAPEALSGMKATFIGIDRNNGQIAIELTKPTRPGGPTYITLTQNDWNVFDIVELANGTGIFELET